MLERARRVKMLVLDVDGVMTDGRIVVSSSGEEMKFFNVQDGVGVTMAREAGLAVAVLSARRSKVTELRAAELGIEEVVVCSGPKLGPFLGLLGRVGLSPEEAACMGDDIHDLGMLARCGFAVAVPNAVEEVKRIAHYITRAPGGHGAVREAVEVILRAQGKYERALARFRP